ncbi:type II toxin-antitoxin system VapB family antitoxin [Niveispirillum sp.]|uniref:type II toxin-antitoxin system VapB family antitoxin n=1 Tax=Niveispirillum sp. TaxID=1917217 RepID=UPI001B3DA458|nr:type II toxin-antitoxin system VapB family antitoxin [Niveispirillum sp.]MBP7339893.1 type II toxin-antitoxin system VapB family antitoxin [Niveispirillum sp.]
MALNIKSPEAEKDVRRLAELTGESLTEAMHKAVRERLERLSAEDESAKTARWAEITPSLRKYSPRPSWTRALRTRSSGTMIKGRSIERADHCR